MPTTLQDLLDIRAIEQSLIAFARAMDARDWDTILAILAPDATGDLGLGPLNSPRAIVDLIRFYLDRCGTTQHMLGNIVVTLNADCAISRAYVHDGHLPAGDTPQDVYYTFGDYHDRWEQRDGHWRLVERIKRNRANIGPMSVFGL